MKKTKLKPKPKSKKIFLDMDGVIVDFMRGAHEYHKLPYSSYPYPVGEWMFTKHLLMDDHDFWSPLGYKFWAELPWMPDGHEIWRMIMDLDPVLCTAPTLHPGCAGGKMQWIKNNLPQMYKRVIITAAKEMCAHPSALLIDDADHNVNKWRANGGVAILVPRIWNSRHAEADNTVEILRKEIRDAGIRSVPQR